MNPGSLTPAPVTFPLSQAALCLQGILRWLSPQREVLRQSCCWETEAGPGREQKQPRNSCSSCRWPPF